MGKKGKNFKKSTRKHSSDDETPAEDERLSRDLKHTGAAFIHPLQHLRHSPNRQRRSPNRRVLVPETPASPDQSQAVSTSADSTAAAIGKTTRLFWDPQTRKLVKSHVPELLAKLGLKETVPTTNAGDPTPSTSGRAPSVELLKNDTIQLPTHPEFNLFNLRKNFPNTPALRGYYIRRLKRNPVPAGELMESYAGESAVNAEEPAENEEPIENLNDALESEIQTQAQFLQEAPIDTLLSESQILEQSTNVLDFNYDSLEFLNNASATREGDIAMLDHLLECMKRLSDINEEFREFFHDDDVMDENWPRGLDPTQKIETYEQCFSKIIELDPNDFYNFPDPGIFQRLVYRGPEVKRIFERKRRVLSIRAPEGLLNSPEAQLPESPESPVAQVSPAAQEPLEFPTPGPSNAVHQPEANRAQNIGHGDFSDDEVPDKSLLIRLALTSELMSAQLDNVLGRQVPPGPYIQDHERNTNYGINARYNHIREVMKNREKEIPAINFPMSTGVDHTRLTQLINPEDFSYPQDDMNEPPDVPRPHFRIRDENGVSINGSCTQCNSCIKKMGDAGNETSLSEETSENYFTTSYPETSEAVLSEATSVNYQADNETTGPGNDTDETGNYREEGVEIDPLANEGSFVLFYSDGNAQLQESPPDSYYNLSSVEPHVEEFDSSGAPGESDDVLDLETPFKFEHEFE